MREYKLKFQHEWMSSDIKPKKIKKNLESSNRWKARRDATKEVREDDRYWYHDRHGTKSTKIDG